MDRAPRTLDAASAQTAQNALKPRILFISTYPELTELARQISAELGVAMYISEGGILRDGQILAKQMENSFDVIISQGGTAAAIKELVTSIPVISIQITVANFLRAIAQAAQYGKPLALLGYACDELNELEEIAKLSTYIEYKIFPYSNKFEFKSQVDKALGLVEHTLISMGGCVRDYARERYLDFVMIRSDYKAIKSAILQAKSIVDKSCRDQLTAQRMKSIIDSSSLGIISIDKSGTITTFNYAAEKILKVNSNNALGKTTTDPSMPESIKHIYGDGEYEVNKLYRLKKNAIIVNRIPIKINNEREETIITILGVSDIQKLEYNARFQLHAKGLVARNTFQNIIAASENFKETINKAIRFSKSYATILIQGETGTGKELFAQSIHNSSLRKNGPFVAINCAALPESLLESELFGHEEGAFTGSKKGGKSGLFEIAHNGTLFLDEIGEISPSLQSRLLRVIQEKEILRVGGDRIINVDVRIVAATNKNLYKMMTEGKFREDLYFRISILNLNILPLRHRIEDLPLLVDHFMNLKCKMYSVPMKTITEEGMLLMKQYNWPGNIRELEVFIEKLTVLYDESIIDESLIKNTLYEHSGNQCEKPRVDETNTINVNVGSLKDMEMQIIETLLKKYNGNKKLLAKDLGISRVTIWNKLNEANKPSYN